jgi:hypothetical protein
VNTTLRRVLEVAVVLALVAVVLATAAYGYFALTFGSADHTQFTVTAERLPPEEIAADATVSLDPSARTLVERAVQNERARTVGDGPDLDGAYVRYEGAYYRVHTEAGPHVTRERPVLTVELADAGVEGVPAAELPSPDRRAFGTAHRAWQIRERDGDGPPVRYVYETVPDAEDSVFVPVQDVQYVTRDGRTFRVRVGNETVSVGTTEVRVRQVAPNESAFRAHLVRDVTGRLNESEAAPLERAIENGTYVSRARTYEDAERPIRPLARALGLGDGPLLYSDRLGRTVYVRYEGAFYRVTVEGYTTAA